MGRRNSGMTVRIGDDRYITAQDAADIAERCLATMYSWKEAEAVEVITRGGQFYFREDDVIACAAMDRDDREELGIRLVSPERSRLVGDYLKRLNDRTRESASHHQDEWTGADMERLRELDGVPTAEVANKLGRTFYSIIMERRRLRGEEVAA